ncbi:epimerase [Streptomyces paromomycinus]|uniref:Epimerase n=2 Tax=Streptomyces paromomycinus TaxID=92743 RepID=A0A401VUG6_STREY|nr:epimerase [Streptomyces paromomycinus]
MTATPGALHTVLGAGPTGTSGVLELARRGHAVRLVDRSDSGEPLDGVQRLTGDEVPALGDIDLKHSCTDILDVPRGLAVLGENPSGDGRTWHLPTAPLAPHARSSPRGATWSALRSVPSRCSSRAPSDRSTG